MSEGRSSRSRRRSRVEVEGEVEEKVKGEGEVEGKVEIEVQGVSCSTGGAGGNDRFPDATSGCFAPCGACDHMPWWWLKPCSGSTAASA